MMLKKQIMKLQTYKMYEGEDTVYVERDDVLKILEQQPCEDMRDATEEERKSTKDYIDSISKPTGLQFDDTYEELDFVQPHKKTSANLQPCEDCISRQDAIDTVVFECGEWTGLAKEISKQLKQLPSVTPSIPDVENNFNLGYNCGYADAMSDIAESEE